MAETVEKLTVDALALSEIERAHLAQKLLRSLEPMEEDASHEWEAEVARRLSRVQNGVADGRPAEEVFRDLRARFGE